jgi:hypothetical protein
MRRWLRRKHMKYVKMLGLAAVAAAALMAFVGASTASATVLCKNNSNTTTCSEKYGVGTEIHAVLDAGNVAKLTTSFKNIECTESTVAGKIENAGSSTTTVSGNITVTEPEPGKTVPELTFGGCNCTVAVLKAGSLEIHQIAGTDNGTLTSSNAEVTASCSTIFGTVHCIYATNATDLGTLTGGNPATLDIESQNIPRLTTNALCDESANWDAKYEVTSPKPLFVAAG